jgi:hypothetical protein
LLGAFDRDGTPTALKRFLETLKENRPDYRLLLTLDHLDALYGRPCSSVVLSGLRVVRDWQRALLEKAWLQMLLIYRITPRQTGPFGSILDVAEVIEVTDFSEGELQKLAQLYGLAGVDIPRLLAFLGGHPALSQLLLVTMKEDDVSLDEVISKAKTGGIFRQHLDRVTTDFRNHPDARQLAKSFGALIGGTPLDSEDTFDALFALGVIKGTYSGDAAVRCELYRDWLPARIPR